MMMLLGLALIVLGAWAIIDNWCVVQIRTRALPRWRRFAPYAALIVGLALMFFGSPAAYAQPMTNQTRTPTVRVPEVDARVRLLVEQAAADEWGVDASPARLAAQLHQESSWNPNARSAVGAEGLAQIMPATGKWLASQFPQVGAYDPWDAAWSARAAAVYDHWLVQRNAGAGTCSSWAFAFSAYNGGEALLHKEQAIATSHGKDGKRWFGNTADYSARSVASWQQNRDYVRRILIVLEPAYIHAGWSGTAVCV